MLIRIVRWALYLTSCVHVHLLLSTIYIDAFNNALSFSLGHLVPSVMHAYFPIGYLVIFPVAKKFI